MADEVIHMERACRGCLREGLHMQPLFPSCGEPRLNVMLMSSTQLQVAENDGLPCQICVYCTDQLSSAFTFKQMCERSDARLRLYVSKNNADKSQSVNNRNSDQIKEERMLRIAKNNDIIDFNSLFNHDMHSVKMERENGDNPRTVNNCDKSSRLNDSTSKSPLNLINNNEKSTQTKALDLVQKLFNCSECNKKFSSVIGLKTHMKWRHDMRDIVSCADCDKIFAKHGYLKKHCLDVHGKNISDAPKIPLDCMICKKSFQYLNNLKQHMLIHGKKKIYNCVNCPRGFNKFQNFEKHKDQCIKISLTCTVCNKDFTNLASLTNHREKHTNDDNEDFNKGTSNSISDNTSKNDDESSEVSPILGVMSFDDSEINIKEEPLEELLEEAERENRLLNDDSNSIVGDDDDIHSMGDYSEEIESDASEYLSDVKVKRKVGRPCKSSSKKYKYKIMKRNENDPRMLKYHCSQCPRKLSSSFRLKVHMAKHYSDQGILYACEDCGKSFNKSSELKKHERLHAGKQFKCNSCDKSFHRQENLEKHMWQHMETKPHQCDKCSKGFMREEHLERHKIAIHSDKKKNPKTAFCTICNRGFTTEKYLETHMRMHTGDKTYTCKICNKSFNTKWHLKEHSKWHSAEKPFLCSECGQRFIRNDYLITHMRRHNGEKPYKCKFCNKGFPRATDLTVHERYHTGEKTHLCTVCGKGFQRQYNLTVHLRVHTGEKPYVCTYCGKRFAQGNDLKSHVRRHTGERFNCEICGEGFIQGYHLTQHKRGIHGIQCTSHIRRVEKHPQGNSSGSNLGKHRNRPTNQLASSIDNQLHDSVNSPQITNASGEGQNAPCIDNETLNIPQHCSVTLQSQLAGVQTVTAEVDLSQRAHAMPALMPIVPLALFPNMHSRI